MIPLFPIKTEPHPFCRNQISRILFVLDGDRCPLPKICARQKSKPSSQLVWLEENENTNQPLVANTPTIVLPMKLVMPQVWLSEKSAKDWWKNTSRSGEILSSESSLGAPPPQLGSAAPGDASAWCCGAAAAPGESLRRNQAQPDGDHERWMVNDQY